MLNWFRKKEIIIRNKEDLISILTRIAEILKDNGYAEQAADVQGLHQFLQKNDTVSFLKYLNTNDIWGGSGAVWEVYLQHRETEKEFMRCMVDLIDKLEETGIKVNGTKGIKNVFKKDLSRN